jgi:hypothetical protein
MIWIFLRNIYFLNILFTILKFQQTWLLIVANRTTLQRLNKFFFFYFLKLVEYPLNIQREDFTLPVCAKNVTDSDADRYVIVRNWLDSISNMATKIDLPDISLSTRDFSSERLPTPGVTYP